MRYQVTEAKNRLMIDGNIGERHAVTFPIAQEEIVSVLGSILLQQIRVLWPSFSAEFQTSEFIFRLATDVVRTRILSFCGCMDPVVECLFDASVATETMKKKKNRKKKKKKKKKMMIMKSNDINCCEGVCAHNTLYSPTCTQENMNAPIPSTGQIHTQVEHPGSSLKEYSTSMTGDLKQALTVSCFGITTEHFMRLKRECESHEVKNMRNALENHWLQHGRERNVLCGRPRALTNFVAHRKYDIFYRPRIIIKCSLQKCLYVCVGE